MKQVGKIGVRLSVLFCAAAIAAGCAAPPPAPVVERARPPAATAKKPAVVAVPAATPAAASADAQPEFYTVKRGDTLYGIALDHGYGYREIADWNQIADPNQIRAGQVLRLRPPAAPAEGPAQVLPVTAVGKVESRPLDSPGSSAPVQAKALDPKTVADGAKPGVKTEPRAYKLPYSPENVALMARSEPAAVDTKADSKPQPKPVPTAVAPKPVEAVAAPKPVEAAAAANPDTQADDDDKVDWMWPSKGRVLAKFSESSNKGLDVGGKIGDPVFASASGRVVYSGSGLRGYGKLVIIKHNKNFLSAYAHNSQVLVKEGQQVVKGQRIADLGDSDADSPKLHFEIRRLGKPVDPL